MKRSLIVLLRPVVLICGDLFILFVLNLNHSCMRVCVCVRSERSSCHQIKRDSASSSPDYQAYYDHYNQHHEA